MIKTKNGLKRKLESFRIGDIFVHNNTYFLLVGAYIAHEDACKINSSGRKFLTLSVIPLQNLKEDVKYLLRTSYDGTFVHLKSNMRNVRFIDIDMDKSQISLWIKKLRLIRNVKELTPVEDVIEQAKKILNERKEFLSYVNEKLEEKNMPAASRIEVGRLYFSAVRKQEVVVFLDEKHFLKYTFCRAEDAILSTKPSWISELPIQDVKAHCWLDSGIDMFKLCHNKETAAYELSYC